MKKTLESVERQFTVLCGAATALIGLIGLSGWVFHIPALVQVSPFYAAMQFNTAAGLVIAGLALGGLERHGRFAVAAGILTALVGSATLLEYVLRVNFGIDELLYHPWLAAEVPGRMALNTAACFVVSGIALAWCGMFPRKAGPVTLAGGYCLLVAAGSALTGYALGIEITYRWGYQTRMAISTAICFGLFGAGLFAFGWKRVKLDRTLWLTLFTAGVVAGTSGLTSYAAAIDYRKMGGSRIVPDVLLFTGITRSCIAAMVVFLWRNSRQNLASAKMLNTSLRDKVMERNAQLDAIFEAVTMGTWTHELSTGKLLRQGQHDRIFGLPAGDRELTFDDLLQAVHPDDRGKLRQAAEGSIRGETSIDVEFRVIWPDNSVHWVLARGGVSKAVDGQPANLSGINLDITRLKNAETALQASEAYVRKLNEELEWRIRVQSRELVESERRFRLMVEGLRDYAFFMLDTEGHVVSWNQGAERIIGYTADAIIGQHFSILFPPEDIDGGHPQDELRQASEQGRFEESGWRMRLGGSRFWAHVLVTAVYNDTGELCGFSKVVRDITERKRIQEVVEEQRRQAEESNRAKSRFLASMSHEIRTPMNAILGMTDLLWETELDEEQRHYVEIFRRAGANLMELINDILDLSKIEAGRLQLEKAEFDVGNVLGEVVELLTPKAQDKGVGLRLRAEPGAIKSVLGDAARLRQVMVNLVGNAIKFTHSGEVVVGIEHRQGGGPGELTFLVSDTGIGIPQDRLGTIFEAFEQADSSTARKYGGTGLGLPISKRLVECMGGTLRVESEPARGSTFYFTVNFDLPAKRSEETARQYPRAQPPPAPPPRAQKGAPEAARQGQPARLLVAEDSIDNQFLISAYLKDTPYTLEFAADGRAAVKQFRESAFDAILMDMEMPEMDGPAAMRSIREMENRLNRRPVPILALTANAHREAIQVCQAAGCTAHVAKPVSKAGLLSALEALLTRQPGTAAPPPTPPLPTPAAMPAPTVPVSVPEGLEALAPKYLSARRKELPEIVALLAADDFEQISSRGHNMKGTGRSYGFPDLTDIGAALERSANHRDKDGIDKQLLRLANYLESVVLTG